MGVFFSGTDMQCLHDQAPAHDMFLSVIVNIAGNVIAKLAIVTNIEKKISFTWMKKVFSTSDVKDQVLTVYNCNVAIQDDDNIVKEFIKIREESERNKIKYTYAPVMKKKEALELYNGVQGEIFTKDVKELDIFNELSDINIENLIVRSFTLDDNRADDLKDVVSLVREQLSDEDQSDMVEMIIDHYEYSLRAEYTPDQFDNAFDRSKRLLNPYRNFRYINNFIFKLNELQRHYGDEFQRLDDNSTGRAVLNEEVERGEDFAITETETNEF